jgi:transposase
MDQNVLDAVCLPVLRYKEMKLSYGTRWSVLSEDEVRMGLYKYITALFNTDGVYIRT